MPVPSTSRSVAARVGSTDARASREFIPGNQTEVKPAASISRAYCAGSSPVPAGGGIQIPTGPSTRRSSSVVSMILLYARESGSLRRGRVMKRPIGAPCWIDLLTSDAPRAQDFYNEILGWSPGEASEQFGGYFMYMRDGVAMAGCMQYTPGAPGMEGPDQWGV